MKKIKFQKKLSLNKETIAKLNDEQMNQVKGGYVEDDSVGGSRSYYYCGFVKQSGEIPLGR